MIIGYSGEGTNDRCTMEALRDLWCPEAVFIEPPHYRGTIKNHKREMQNTCIEFDMKDADLFVFFRDANKENFRSVKDKESAWIPEQYKHKSIYAVADRNVESWLSADRNHTISTMDVSKEDLDDDPNSAVDRYFGSYRDEERCDKIKDYIKQAPLKNWLQNQSFHEFYDDCRDFAQRNSCTRFPNIRDN